MQKTVDLIASETPGCAFQLSVLRFAGSDPAAPSAYLQAALHGNELPGVAALHALIPQIAAAEAEGRLAGSVTVVPFANPIAGSQHAWGEHMGRFALGSRINFNRDFPLADRPDPALLPDDPMKPAEVRLKAKLLSLSFGHEIVLDLHCDDEAVPYLYVPKPLWPKMSDLAAALGCEAVLVWEGTSDAAFEEAALHPYLQLPPAEARLEQRVVTTVELRGRADVSAAQGEADAAGLYRFLVARGTIRDDRLPALPAYEGLARPQDHVEMVRAPIGGAILFAVRPGDRVSEGDAVATIVHAPGEAGGTVVVTAPQSGYVLTRRAHRFTRAGDDLLKIIGALPAAGARPGSLES